MAELKTVGMELIHANPYRMLHAYPWVEEKLDALQKSIADVGFWEGVIARPRAEGGYELAFGHHRIEAARRFGLNRVNIIVRDLTDEEMVKFMGRENGEDYRADFLTMMNSWEGAVDFFTHGEKVRDIDVARLLGWTRKMTVDGKEYDVMNRVSESCSDAYVLLHEGHLTKDDLSGISVTAAGNLCAPLIKELKSLNKREEYLKKSNPPAKVEKAVDNLRDKAVQATKEVAHGVREGTVPSSKVRNETGTSILKAQKREADPVPPDFGRAVLTLDSLIEKIFDEDSYYRKLNEIIEVVPHLPEGEYIQRCNALLNTLDELKKRVAAKAAELDIAICGRITALEVVK